MGTCTIAVMLVPLLALALMYAPAVQARDITAAPEVVPPSCSAIIVASMEAKTGSEMYVALSYQLAALAEAEEAVVEMDRGLLDMRTATTPNSMMAAILSSATNAQNKMHCAAYLLGQWHPAGLELQRVAPILISVYNRKALFIATTSDRAKRKFLTVDKPETPVKQLADAEQQAAFGQETKQASTDLLDYTVFTLMKSVDISDQKAKIAEYLNISCAERADILDRSTKLRGQGNVDGDDFRVNSGLIAQSMQKRKCHESP